MSSSRTKVDLTGKKFSMLTVSGMSAPGGKGRSATWKCICDCGNIAYVSGDSLRRNHTKSCGCLSRQLKHNGVGTRLYNTWNGIKARCGNQSAPSYPYYGGRGIIVCEEWEDFINFQAWSMASGYDDSLTIDRIDNNKGYTPDNCRWATPKEQANNRRNNLMITNGGKTQNITQWAQETGIKVTTIHARIKSYGWTMDRALTTK